MVDQFRHTKTPFDTQPHLDILGRSHAANHLLLLYLQAHLAANAAEGAGRRHLAIRFSVPLARFLNQRARRAGLHTGAAKSTAGLHQTPAKSSPDHGLRTPLGIGDGAGKVQLVTNADTTPA
jgi:hypothetical protein